MTSADSLNPSQRARLRRITLQASVNDYVEAPQRQAMAEQYARDARRYSRDSHRRDQVQLLAIPVLITFLLFCAVAFALLLISPSRPQISPYGDAIGALQTPEPARQRNALQDRESLVAQAREIAAADRIPPGLLARYNGRGPMARAYAQRVLRAWEAAE